MQNVFWTSTATRQIRNASSAAGWSSCSCAHSSASCARSSYWTRQISPTRRRVEVGGHRQHGSKSSDGSAGRRRLTRGPNQRDNEGRDGYLAGLLSRRNRGVAAALLRGPARPDGLHPLAHAAGDAARHRGQDDHLGLEGLVGRRRRPRRGQGRAARGDRLPHRPGALRPARRACAQGDPALRAAGNRQDAAREGDRERGGRALLRAERLGVRRDVRRPRRRADPQAVRRGAQERALDRLHRRARRGRRAAHRPRLLARAGPDAEPAARRARRLRVARPGDRDGRLQPAPGSRRCAPAPRPLRPAGARRRARPGRPRGDPARPHARQAARRPTSTCARSRVRPRA